MKLPKSTKKMIREEREKCFIKMSNPDIDLDDWEELNTKYQAYDEMLKPSWKFTPDTVLVVGGQLLSILCILNFERFDIVRSKAIGFVMKGRV